MKYETAKRRKNVCITTFLILIMWGWGGLRSHLKAIQENPETGLLFFGCVYGIPLLLLLCLIIFYSIKAKQAEYDEFDDELDTKDSSDNQNDENRKAP